MVEPVCPFQDTADVDHRLDLCDRAHFRQREQEPVRQLARVDEGADEHIESAQAARASRLLHRFDSDADERWCSPSAQSLGDGVGGLGGIGILDGIAAVAVTVLEIEPQVFYGFSLELHPDARGEGFGEVGAQSDPFGEGREPTGVLDGGARSSTPLGGQRRGVPIRGNIYGVHRLPRTVVARVGGAKQSIGVTQGGIDAIEVGIHEHPVPGTDDVVRHAVHPLPVASLWTSMCVPSSWRTHRRIATAQTHRPVVGPWIRSCAHPVLPDEDDDGYMPAAHRPGLRVDAGLTIPESELSWRFSRSSGPGGQGVNTADSRVELVWDAAHSAVLSPIQRERLLDHLSGRLVDGVLTIAASEHRAQLRNRDAARARLATIVAGALRPPPPSRRPTTPSRGAKERLLKAKKRRADLKRLRQPPLD
jgi:ribosome-associated protein